MLRGFVAWLTLLVVTPLCAVPGAVFGHLGRRDLTMRCGRAWGRVMLRATGTRPRHHDLDRLLAVQPAIYVVNHQSNVDVWMLVDVLPLNTRFVAKASLFRIPLLGRAMRAAGFIPIERANRSRAIRSLDTAVERIHAGSNVLLFPEGTRSRDGRLQPFKKGPFHLALRAGVPLIPIVIEGTHRIHRAGDWRVRGGDATLRVLEPVDVAPFLPSDHSGLRHEVHGRFAAALAEDRTD